METPSTSVFAETFSLFSVISSRMIGPLFIQKVQLVLVVPMAHVTTVVLTVMNRNSVKLQLMMPKP